MIWMDFFSHSHCLFPFPICSSKVTSPLAVVADVKLPVALGWNQPQWQAGFAQWISFCLDSPLIYVKHVFSSGSLSCLAQLLYDPMNWMFFFCNKAVISSGSLLLYSFFSLFLLQLRIFSLLFQVVCFSVYLKKTKSKFHSNWLGLKKKVHFFKEWAPVPHLLFQIAVHLPPLIHNCSETFCRELQSVNVSGNEFIYDV